MHTGGIELDSITVLCQTNEELMSSGSGIKEGTFTDSLLCLSMSDCAQRTFSLGPVSAGEMYTCIVTASNSIGSDVMKSNSITTITGKL